MIDILSFINEQSLQDNKQKVWFIISLILRQKNSERKQT
jgi:hypothetical protein